MLVKYIGPKKRATVWLPIGIASQSEWERSGQKAAAFAPDQSQELPDAEAMKLVRLDPTNFALDVLEADVVEAPAAEADVHVGLIEPCDHTKTGCPHGAEYFEDSANAAHREAASQPLDGTEFAEAIEALPAKRRGRKKA